VGHAGHGAPKQNGNKLFSLQDQIAHKITFLQILKTPNNELFPNNDTRVINSCENIPTKEFILIGHSIGAYIAFKV
jgi:alpha-beta hydrolase superfamily lysophospholipase